MKYAWWFVWLLAVGLVVVGGLAGCDGDGDDDTVTVVVTNAADDAAPEPECEEGDMVGTWAAPEEVEGTVTRFYSFTLHADGSASFDTTEVDSGPPPTGSGSSGIGTWGLAGCNLVLDGFGGGGEVSGNQVTTDGRTFTKQ